MLSQTDLEQLARQMRARGLHLSWNELLELSASVVGSLADAEVRLSGYCPEYQQRLTVSAAENKQYVAKRR